MVPFTQFAVPVMPTAPANTPVAPDALAWAAQANAELERARAHAEAEQEGMDLARQRWQRTQEHSHAVLMRQVPKLVGACVVGVLLAYLLPLGADR